MSLLARNSSKCRRICFEVRLNLKIICLYKYLLYTVHILYIICYINMQCTIMLESNSMFYHFSSDSTVCTSCLPSLSIDRCKSTRFPVVGQNHIQNVRFLSTKNGRVVCFCGYLLPFYIELNSCFGRLRQPLTFMSWRTMIDIFDSHVSLSPFGLFGKVQLAVVPEALHDCHRYFSKGWRFGRACLGEIPFRLVFWWKLMTGPCHLKPQVWT